MKILILGGGPGGLYSGALIKKAHPSWDVTVLERNPPDATYGWGVVFSDRTLTSFREADYRSYKDITDNFVIWDAVDIHYAGTSIRCGGNVFAGISRKVLLSILQKRCREVGVHMKFLVDVKDLADIPDPDDYDLVIASDGINSLVRKTFAEAFEPTLLWRKSKYIWLGTRKVFDAFTFAFHESEHGLFQAHIYPNDGEVSTFVVLCDPDSWRRAGLDHATEAESVAYCERVFAPELGGEPLLPNKSEWITFATVRNQTWRHGKFVLLGDSAHTADFTIGSGTKLAMEDSIALANAFERFGDQVDRALSEYELERKPQVEALQAAALESGQYFENIKRYAHFEPMQFAYYLLTRSGRISYNELRRRDSAFVDAVDRWFFERTTNAGNHSLRVVAPPPMLAPFRLRDLALPNRVVLSPPPTDEAQDGVPSEAYCDRLQELSSSEAGLLLTEPVAVCAEGRITSGCPGLYGPEHAALWSRSVKSLQAHSVSVGIRLAHAGRRGANLPRHVGLDRPLPDGWTLLSASPLPYTPASPVPKEMDRNDMDQVRTSFVRAAQMARECGFDLLQLFFGHGNLVASFLSPLTNRRRDAYGGSLDNRMRFPLEIVDAVREVWPEDKPLSVAFTGSDCVRGGLRIADAVQAARLLHAHGCDLIEVVVGQTVPEGEPSYGPSFLAPYSDWVRNEAHVPTLTGGFITTSDEVNNIIAGGRADLCVLETPYLNPRYRWIPHAERPSVPIWHDGGVRGAPEEDETLRWTEAR